MTKVHSFIFNAVMSIYNDEEETDPIAGVDAGAFRHQASRMKIDVVVTAILPTQKAVASLSAANTDTVGDGAQGTAAATNPFAEPDDGAL